MVAGLPPTLSEGEPTTDAASVVLCPTGTGGFVGPSPTRYATTCFPALAGLDVLYGLKFPSEKIPFARFAYAGANDETVTLNGADIWLLTWTTSANVPAGSPNGN